MYGIIARVMIFGKEEAGKKDTNTSNKEEAVTMEETTEAVNSKNAINHSLFFEWIIFHHHLFPDKKLSYPTI